MIGKLRKYVRKNLFLRKLIGYHLASSGWFDNFFRNYKVSAAWQNRINAVLASSDNARIPKIQHAGQINNGKQIMHNGVKIYVGSYYGPEYAKMLLLSGGVHEPQEERVFGLALKTLGEDSLMIEMGAFWSFYSIWFQKEVRNAVNYMIEPDTFNIGQGKRNFRLNNMKGNFIQSFVGRRSENTLSGKTLCIDDFVRQNEIRFIHMLHSDIQGFEYEMLLGAEKTFAEKKIGYVFISTHSNDLHYRCLAFLKERNFFIIAAADLDETFSEDGLIAARAYYMAGLDAVDISKRSRGASV